MTTTTITTMTTTMTMAHTEPSQQAQMRGCAAGPPARAPDLHRTTRQRVGVRPREASRPQVRHGALDGGHGLCRALGGRGGARALATGSNLSEETHSNFNNRALCARSEAKSYRTPVRTSGNDQTTTDADQALLRTKPATSKPRRMSTATMRWFEQPTDTPNNHTSHPIPPHLIPPQPTPRPTPHHRLTNHTFLDTIHLASSDALCASGLR